MGNILRPPFAFCSALSEEADVLAEAARAGLLVTTSDISPGAASDIVAHAYPITNANCAQVQQWISAMRKPDAGIVAGDRTAQQNEPQS
nr:hypothetical protein [Acetobacter persici]